MDGAVFDIETTALGAAGSGIALCVCVRPLRTKRTKTFRIDGYSYPPEAEFGFFERQERDMLRDAVEELSKFQLLVGHNIENFDLGFLRTRAMMLGVPFTIAPFTYDTMKGFRRTKMRTTMNYRGKPTAAMDFIVDMFGLPQQKTKIYPVEWWQSVWGNGEQRAEAMNHIVDHCVRDVRMNHEMYELMLPWDIKASFRRWM